MRFRLFMGLTLVLAAGFLVLAFLLERAEPPVRQMQKTISDDRFAR